MFRPLLHKLAHLLHINRGEVETWYESGLPDVVRTDGPTPGDDRLMVGFRCKGCRKLDHVYEAPPWPKYLPWSPP